MKSLSHLKRVLLQLAAGFGVLIAALTAGFYAVFAPSADQFDQLLRSAGWAVTIVGMSLYYRFCLWLNSPSFGEERLAKILRNHLHCNDIVLFFIELACVALLFIGLLRLLIVAVSVFGSEPVVLAFSVFFCVGLTGLGLFSSLLFWWDWRAARNRSTGDEDGPC